VTDAELTVSVLPAGAGVDGELDAFFDACPTSFAQQTRRWRDVITHLGVDEPLFLGCRRNGELAGVLPAYRFDGPLGAILNSVPQAGPIGGVACRPGEPADAIYGALLRAYTSLAAETGCALASVISNPVWPDRVLYERLFEPNYTLENSCLILDLEQVLDGEGELALPPSNLRRNLRRARSGALRIDEEQSPENVDEWYEIHRTRHLEIGATPLPKGLFTGAFETMVPAGAARFFFVRRSDSGEMVAGGFYVFHGQVVDALMPSMRSDAAKLAPNFLLAWHSIDWARKRGLRYYNWQASPPGGGVDRFKRQWGSRDHAYCYFTKITGDAEPILGSSVAEISAGYPWHYVLPFDRIGAVGDASRRTSTRAGAWSARESCQ
jgi:hypothetical protein